jgi:hypothetical protein
MRSRCFKMNIVGTRRRHIGFFMVYFRILSMKRWSHSNDWGYCFGTYWCHSFRRIHRFLFTLVNNGWMVHWWGSGLVHDWNCACVVSCCNCGGVANCRDFANVIHRCDFWLSVVTWNNHSMANRWSGNIGLMYCWNFWELDRGRFVNCWKYSRLTKILNDCWLMNSWDNGWFFNCLIMSLKNCWNCSWLMDICINSRYLDSWDYCLMYWSDRLNGSHWFMWWHNNWVWSRSCSPII